MFRSSRGRPKPAAPSKWGSGSGQSLRRSQKGGQNGSMGPQKKTEKLTVPPARSSIWCQQWVKMAHNGSKWLQIGPQWPTVGSKWHKMAHSRVKMGQNGSKCPTEGQGAAKAFGAVKNGVKMGPTKNRKANSASGAVVHMVPAMPQNGSQWLKMAQNRPKMAHGRVKIAQNGPQ